RLQAAAAAVVHEMAADVQERVVVAEIGNDVAFPDLVEQGLSRHVGVPLAQSSRRADPEPNMFCRRLQLAGGERRNRTAVPVIPRPKAEGPLPLHERSLPSTLLRAGAALGMTVCSHCFVSSWPQPFFSASKKEANTLRMVLSPMSRVMNTTRLLRS